MVEAAVKHDHRTWNDLSLTIVWVAVEADGSILKKCVEFVEVRSLRRESDVVDVWSDLVYFLVGVQLLQILEKLH